MKSLALTATLFLSLYSYSQKDIYCDGMEKVEVKSFVAINGHEQKNKISKNNLNEFDLFIALSDTSFKILGFIASYDCHSGSFFDLSEKKYFGNKIKANDGL